jgi:hypothetical protein
MAQDNTGGLRRTRLAEEETQEGREEEGGGAEG